MEGVRMYRLMYRNPFVSDSIPRIVQTSDDLEEVKQNKFNIAWSVGSSNKPTVDDEEFVWIEDLSTGRKLD